MITIIEKQDIRPLGSLALTRTAGWGMLCFTPVLGPAMAADLGLSLPLVFAGISLLFITIALATPAAGRLIARHGPRAVMLRAAPVSAAGLALIAVSHGATALFTGWGLCGLGAAGLLTTAARDYLSRMAGPRAPGLGRLLTLVAGLSTPLFFVISALLGQWLGWRLTLLCYACAYACVLPPILFLGLRPLPHRPAAPPQLPLPWHHLPSDSPAIAPPAMACAPLARSPLFWTFTLVIALNAFITLGVSALAIPLFLAMGSAPQMAVAAGAALGLFKIGGRLLDPLGLHAWGGLSAALTAAAMMPCGLALLLLCGNTLPGAGAFLLFFGLGSGGFAVARAGLPGLCQLHGQDPSAARTIALPLTLGNALAPPLLARLLVTSGPLPLLMTLTGLSLVSVLILLALGRAITPGLARG